MPLQRHFANSQVQNSAALALYDVLRFASPGWHAKVGQPRATPNLWTPREEPAGAARFRPESGGVSQGHCIGGGGNLAGGARRGDFARLQLVAQD